MRDESPPDDGLIRRSELEVQFDRKGKPTYQLEIWHAGLAKHRVVRGDDKEIVLRKAELEVLGWQEKWKTQQELRLRQTEEERAANLKRSKLVLAARQTRSAQTELENLGRTLKHTLDLDDAIDWESLKDDSEFDEPEPRPPSIPQPPRVRPPAEPSGDAPAYKARLEISDRLMPSRRALREAEAVRRYQADVNTWKERCAEAERETEALQSEYVAEVNRLKDDYADAIEAWEAARVAFTERKKRNHQAVARQKRRYKEQRPEAIEEYCDLVLSNSEYPDFFPKRWHLDYRDEDRTLVVDYWLPRPGVLPTLKRGQYLEASDEFVQQQLSKAERNRIYTDLLCQTVLRSIHEFFEADVVESLDFIALNGRVIAPDPATGIDTETCVSSVKVSRTRFLGLDLRRLKPKRCVSLLSGGKIGPLHKLVSVEPCETCRPISPPDSYQPA